MSNQPMSNQPMSEERFAEIRAKVAHREWAADAIHIKRDDVGGELLAEVERLRAREAEWDSKEQALQKSIAEHERVIAKIEARYEQQGQYNHELVRRLNEAMEIVKATAQRGVTVYDSEGKSYGNAFLSVEIVTKARALLAQHGEEPAS